MTKDRDSNNKRTEGRKTKDNIVEANNQIVFDHWSFHLLSLCCFFQPFVPVNKAKNAYKLVNLEAFELNPEIMQI